MPTRRSPFLANASLPRIDITQTALGRTHFPLSKNTTNPDGHGWKGKQQKGGRNTPLTKKKETKK